MIGVFKSIYRFDNKYENNNIILTIEDLYLKFQIIIWMKIIIMVVMVNN